VAGAVTMAQAVGPRKFSTKKIKKNKETALTSLGSKFNAVL
jgi:hypothetical protein